MAYGGNSQDDIDKMVSKVQNAISGMERGAANMLLQQVESGKIDVKDIVKLLEGQENVVPSAGTEQEANSGLNSAWKMLENMVNFGITGVAGPIFGVEPVNFTEDDKAFDLINEGGKKVDLFEEDPIEQIKKMQEKNKQNY